MHSTYFIKHLVAVATTPLACGLALSIAGAIVRAFGRRRAATVIWIGSACLVYLSATAPVSNALLTPLEERYPPLGDVQNLPPVRYIVVLGNGYGQRDDIPVTAALPPDALARITEGVRLMRPSMARASWFREARLKARERRRPGMRGSRSNSASLPTPSSCSTSPWIPRKKQAAWWRCSARRCLFW